MGRAGTAAGLRRSLGALVAGLLGVALLAAGASPAAADEHPGDTPRDRLSVEDFYRLIGYADTPDQGTVAPDIPRGRARLESSQADPQPLPVLPDIEEEPKGEAGRKYPFCTRKAGPYQRKVERYLGLPVDGKQSAEDCKAIQKYQRSKEIWPTVGYAGPVTHGELMLAKVRKKPNAKKVCPVNEGRVVCVDMTRQILWVQDGRKLVFVPVPIRTGRPGFETRTGMHRIYWRNKDHWSTLYDAPMPYAQFFDGGQSLHGTYASVYNPPGSHGCVNLRFAEARALWSVLKTGDKVFVFGKRPVRR